MEILIRAHHVDITAPIKECVEKKLGKLDKFFDHIQEISVDLDVSEVSEEDKRQTVTATVWVSGSVMRAKEATRDMYASIDGIFDKLEKQLVKYKEKLKHRNRPGGKRHFERPKDAKGPSKVKEKPKVQRYIPKPMEPEDAADILQLNHLDFLMFRNASSQEINVLFVDDDGEFELLEP